MEVSIKGNGIEEFSMDMEKCYSQMAQLKKDFSNSMFIRDQNRMGILLKLII